MRLSRHPFGRLNPGRHGLAPLSPGPPCSFRRFFDPLWGVHPGAGEAETEPHHKFQRSSGRVLKNVPGGLFFLKTAKKKGIHGTYSEKPRISGTFSLFIRLYKQTRLEARMKNLHRRIEP